MCRKIQGLNRRIAEISELDRLRCLFVTFQTDIFYTTTKEICIRVGRRMTNKKKLNFPEKD